MSDGVRMSDERIASNPFYVLGLAPDASRIEVEREAQKLLGMLELDFAAARVYATPLGDRPRTPEAVRAAVAALPAELREAIVLFEYEQMSQAEIAAVVGATAKAVESRVARAREKLRAALERWA